MKQILVKDIEELKKLIVGKKIINIIQSDSIYDDHIGIGEIILDDNTVIDLWGAADYAMVDYIWQEEKEK